MTEVVRLQTEHNRVLQLIRAKYPHYHPVVAMVDLAHHEDVKNKDPKLEFEIHKAVAPYCEAKLSSMEVRAPKEPTRIVVSLFEQMTLENGQTTEVEVPLIREISEVVPLDAD